MKKIQILILVAFVVVGCDNFLEPENVRELTEDSFWQTSDDARQAMMSAYGTLQSYNGSKWTFFEQMYIGLAWKSDDVLNAPTDYGKSIANFTNGTDDATFSSFWRSNYTGINYANQIIERVPEMEGLSQEERDELVAEAKFLRGFFHFQLLVAFENVPLITSTPKSVDDFYVSQVSPSEVWAQIESDLTDAKNGMPDSWDDANLGRATSHTAAAYLGKAHLFQEEWTAAIGEFDDVINSGAYALLDNYEDNFNGNSENGEESVFEIQWSGNRTNGNDERHPFNFEVTPGALGGWELYYPSDWLLTEMQTDVKDDGTYSDRVYGSVFFDDSLSTMFNINTGEMIAYDSVRDDLSHPKWFKKYSGDFDLSFYNAINIHLMRYADVLLMQAEALNENGQTADAIALVNQVRARSGAADLAGLDQAALRAQIRHHERPVELSMEYTIRWFDLYRWAKGSTAAEPISQTMADHDKPSAENYIDGVHDVFPIPLSEMDKNANLVQNPGF